MSPMGLCRFALLCGFEENDRSTNDNVPEKGMIAQTTAPIRKTLSLISGNLELRSIPTGCFSWETDDRTDA